MKNIARDKSRLQECIGKKTCSNCRFHQLDDSQFQKAVSRYNFGLRLEIHNLNAVIDFLDKTDLDTNNKINGLIKEKSNLKEELSTVKEQLKNANDQQKKIKN